MIEHRIYHDARYADVQPDWKRPAGDLAMTNEIAAQRQRQRDNREYRHRGGQNDVRGQNEKIDGPYRARFQKPHISNSPVINEVASQKCRRYAERRNHRSPVRPHAFVADEVVAGEEQRRRGGVQRRVHRWKIVNLYHLHAIRRGPAKARAHRESIAEYWVRRRFRNTRARAPFDPPARIVCCAASPHSNRRAEKLYGPASRSSPLGRSGNTKCLYPRCASWRKRLEPEACRFPDRQ